MRNRACIRCARRRGACGCAAAAPPLLPSPLLHSPIRGCLRGPSGAGLRDSSEQCSPLIFPPQALAVPVSMGPHCDPCSITHAGVGHLWHALEFCVKAFPRAIPVRLS